MHELMTLAQNHQVVAGAALAIVASSAVRALPDPTPQDGKFYLWFYKFAHGVLANWDLVKTAGR